MLHYAAFHLALHCLPKYLSWGFRSTKGYRFMLSYLVGVELSLGARDLSFGPSLCLFFVCARSED